MLYFTVWKGGWIMPAVNVHIHPEILVWALSQVTKEKLGKKLTDNIKYWLDGSKTPTFRQIEELSKKTYIPLGYFFLKKTSGGRNESAPLSNAK